MTALKEYARLESGGLWRSDPDAQRRDVVVSFGNATLVIADSSGRALAHWSLAAVERVNPGASPALFSPDTDQSETLEIADDTMVDAIEQVRRAIARQRPRPGRLRHLGLGLTLAAVLGLGVFWLPGALIDQAVTVVPATKRAEIGATLLGHVQRLTGPSCRSPLGNQALSRLHDRLFAAEAPGQVVVVPDGPDGAVALPGGIIVVSRSVIEDTEDPAVVAGHVIAARVHAGQTDPLRDILDRSGFGATLTLLTTGDMSPAALRTYAEDMLAAPPARPGDTALVAAFTEARIPTTPYAYSVDVSGESTLGLIEADPFADTTVPLILDDGSWISLQGICGG